MKSCYTPIAVKYTCSKGKGGQNGYSGMAQFQCALSRYEVLFLESLGQGHEVTSDTNYNANWPLLRNY